MPESVFTQTIPLLLAGGVCCWADWVDLVGAGLLAGAVPEAGAAGALLAVGVGAELAAGLEAGAAEEAPAAPLAVGAAEPESAAVAFFDRLF